MQFVVVWLCCYVAWRCPFRCQPFHLLCTPFSPSLASKYSSPLGFFVAIMYAVCFVLSDVRSFVGSFVASLLLFFVAPKLTTISFHLLSEVNSSVPRSFIPPLPFPPLPCLAHTHTHCHLIFCHFMQLLLPGLIILTASAGWREGRRREGEGREHPE